MLCRERRDLPQEDLAETFPELRDLEAAGSHLPANSRSDGKPVLNTTQNLKTTVKNLIDVGAVKANTSSSVAMKM
jgi:hypothetical protein